MTRRTHRPAGCRLRVTERYAAGRRPTPGCSVGTSRPLSPRPLQPCSQAALLNTIDKLGTNERSDRVESLSGARARVPIRPEPTKIRCNPIASGDARNPHRCWKTGVDELIAMQKVVGSSPISRWRRTASPCSSDRATSSMGGGPRRASMAMRESSSSTSPGVAWPSVDGLEHGWPGSVGVVGAECHLFAGLVLGALHVEFHADSPVGVAAENHPVTGFV